MLVFLFQIKNLRKKSTKVALSTFEMETDDWRGSALIFLYGLNSCTAGAGNKKQMILSGENP